jgi:hypothetical protein
MAERTTQGRTPAPLLAPGDVVAIWTVDQPPEVYATLGEVQAVDAWGVRLTSFDHLVGGFCHWDFVLPWSRIIRMTVATAKHDKQEFVRQFLKASDAHHAEPGVIDEDPPHG